MKSFFVSLIFSLTFSLQVFAADYVAYSVIDNVPKPLPEVVDKIEAKELVILKWGKYSGNKVRVGVMSVKNKSSTSSVYVSGRYGHSVTYRSGGSGVPVDGIDAIITDVMHRSKRFRVLERVMLKKALKEQDLGASGRISKPSAARTGKVLGAQYLVQAVITHYEPNYEGKKFGLGGLTGGLLGGLKIGSSKSMVGMNFRLIDATTSEIIFSKQVNAVMSDSSIGFGALGFGGGGILGGFMESYSKTPVGLATIAAVNIGIYELVKQIGSAPSSGSVIKAKSGKVYINMGKGRVNAGDRLKLMSKGESMIDPETGMDLGGDDQEIGMLQVVSVKSKFSIAKPVGQIRGKIKSGDKVLSTRQAAPLKYAATWSGSSTSSSSGSSGSNNDGNSDGGDDDF